MPRFEPFPGLLYDVATHDLAAGDRSALRRDRRGAARRPRRPPPPPGGAPRPPGRREGDANRYRVACRILGEWRDQGVLVQDPTPAFYVYRMDHVAEDGTPRHTTGVIGALELSPPGEGDILPHEETTQKDKTDRLEMLRYCRANTSAIWGLSPAAGLTELCQQADDLVGDWTDDDGVRHRLWRPGRPRPGRRRQRDRVAHDPSSWPTATTGTRRRSPTATSGGPTATRPAPTTWR
ncbi:MAG: DUF1015 family protein [Acidimicrobiia bacterium]|nr:DUF1015 family protein [Acidimicrobiia bacterium]